MLNQKTFQKIISSTPLVSIDLCLIHKDSLLLGKRTNEPLKGRWFTPGGRIMKNERWEDCIERIAKVELGINLSHEVFELMGVWNHFYDTSSVSMGISTHYVNLPHIYIIDKLPHILTDDQHEEMKWFKLMDFLSSCDHHHYMKLYADHIIKNYLK